MMRTPKCTRSGYSTIVRWSVVRYGSHSAPFTSSHSISCSGGGLNLTCVGKAAPPRPTTPAACTAPLTCAASRPSHCGTMRGLGICGLNSSTSMTTVSAIEPSGWGHQSTAATVPAAEA